MPRYGPAVSFEWDQVSLGTHFLAAEGTKIREMAFASMDQPERAAMGEQSSIQSGVAYS